MKIISYVFIVLWIFQGMYNLNYYSNRIKITVVMAGELSSANSENVSIKTWLNRKKIKLGKKDNNGFTLLHHAAKDNNVKAMKYLLEMGEDIEARTNVGSTPLLVAARFASMDAVNWLIARKANLGALTNDGRSIVQMMVLNGNAALFKSMLDAGVDTSITTPKGNTLMHYAAFSNSVEMLQLINQAGLGVTINNKGGYESIHFAAKHGKLSALSWLKQNGADVRTKSYDGFEPIHEAVKDNSVTGLKWLLENGADVNVTNKDKENLLHLAVEFNALDVLKELCDSSGINVNAMSDYGKAPLYVAAEHDNIPAMRILLAHGADVNISNSRAPLSEAISRKSVDSVRILLEHNARLLSSHKYEASSHPEILELLEEAERRYNARYQREEKEREARWQSQQREFARELERKTAAREEKENAARREREVGRRQKLSAMPVLNARMAEAILAGALGKANGRSVGCGFENITYGMSAKDVSALLKNDNLVNDKVDASGVSTLLSERGDVFVFKNDKLISTTRRIQYGEGGEKALQEYMKLFGTLEIGHYFETSVRAALGNSRQESFAATTLYNFTDSLCALQLVDIKGAGTANGKVVVASFMDKAVLTDLLNRYIHDIYPLLAILSAELSSVSLKNQPHWNFPDEKDLTYSFTNIGGRISARNHDTNSVNYVLKDNFHILFYVMIINSSILEELNSFANTQYNRKDILRFNISDGILTSVKPYFNVKWANDYCLEVLHDASLRFYLVR